MALLKGNRMFAIKHNTTKKYVTISGSKKSYVRSKLSESVRLFKTAEEAKANLCPENEHIVEFGFGSHGIEW